MLWEDTLTSENLLQKIPNSKLVFAKELILRENIHIFWFYRLIQIPVKNMDLVLLSSLHFVWHTVPCCGDSLSPKRTEMLNLTSLCTGTFFSCKSYGFRLHGDVGNSMYGVKTNPLDTVCTLVVLIGFENSFTFPK